MKKFLLGPYYNFTAIFVVVFCIIAVLALDVDHPLYMAALGMGLAVSFLQMYRKRLIKKEGESNAQKLRGDLTDR